MTLNDLLSTIESNKRPIAKGLVVELNFMAKQLVKIRKEINAKGVTEPYTQGMRTFDRQTPAFQAYNQIVARYAQLMKQLVALLPEDDSFELDELDEFLAGYE